MVDQESLDLLKEERNIAESPNPPRILPLVKVRVVDAEKPNEVQDNDDEDDGRGEADEDEGDNNDSEGEINEKWDIEWMWVIVDLLLGFYDVL